MLSTEMDLSSKFIESPSGWTISLSIRLRIAEHTEHFRYRIEEAVYHALFERNDCVVGDGDVFGADLGATLRYIAQADAELLSQVFDPIAHVQGMHFERRCINEEPRADELVMHV